MENLGLTGAFWRDRRVFLTGHTGFKGGWLTLWLEALGAKVHGFALPPPTRPNLFDAAGIEAHVSGSTLGDLADRALLANALQQAQPEVVFHLAAQPLVRHSYAFPVETFATNVLGTVHLLEAVRGCPSVRAVVNVTTDKCYENQEWPWGYRENDPLGGADPYASSKACSELVTAAYRRSFLGTAGVGVATARAGNVIGGGDWAADRLLPDAFRALDGGKPLIIRAPGAIRPWQHVLESLSGYLALAERLHEDGQAFAGAWNFGPSEQGARSVADLLGRLAELEPTFRWEHDASPQPHETSVLMLDSTRTRLKLGWQPRWQVETALARSLAWHQAWRQGRDMAEFTLEQIRDYSQSVGERTSPS
ncbi:CDP-glucose 4,6-dehydratase [Geothrix sp.]|uniref:CDP-glucose 4,6-dehydratase n=1 Tax=Geothrix sp. TaxID=1962974 RepID=UPI0025BBFC16|nr:CDP-glucose 4,6-dehydratase [Geothrix sp.]WIL20856.1 MAG: CDP-glucose 4,6-dehydratase [Geothrix sp.]